MDIESSGVPLLSVKAQTAASWHPGFHFPGGACAEAPADSALSARPAPRL